MTNIYIYVYIYIYIISCDVNIQHETYSKHDENNNYGQDIDNDGSDYDDYVGYVADDEKGDDEKNDMILTIGADTTHDIYVDSGSSHNLLR